jgi:hypothetical protein
MSTDSAAPVEIDQPSPQQRGRVPKRFFLATLALYALILGTYLLRNTVLQTAIPNWRTVVPTLSGVSFYILATLFLLILGRGRVSRWVVLIVIACTFVYTAGLCLLLRSPGLYNALDPNAPAALRSLIGAMAQFKNAAFAGDSVLARAAQLIVMIMIEEAVKLLPVFVLISTGRIRTAHGAMLCGALSGLTFGTVEAVSYGYLQYPQLDRPITDYFTRFLVASPMHGVWDALAGGLVFFLSGRWRFNALRRPGAFAYLAAYSIAVAVHVAHNTLQEIVGARMQIVTAFALLAPLYATARYARRRALAAGEIPDTRVIGDLHMLAISMATWFMASSVLFAWSLEPK